MIPKSPCKDCPDRHPVCHDSCEKYLDYRDKHIEKVKLDNMHKMSFGMTTGKQSKKKGVRYY